MTYFYKCFPLLNQMHSNPVKYNRLDFTQKYTASSLELIL